MKTLDLEGLRYELHDDNTASVIKYIGRPSGRTVSVPSVVRAESKSFTVTAIGESAFRATWVSKIEIPSSVQILGEFCFDECKSLCEVVFMPNSQLKAGVWVIGHRPKISTF
jgi:hypothetical protein